MTFFYIFKVKLFKNVQKISTAYRYTHSETVRFDSI